MTLTEQHMHQHRLLCCPVGKRGSGARRYAAAMYFYQEKQMTAQLLEIYRRCSKFDQEDPVDLAAFEGVQPMSLNCVKGTL